MEKMELITCKTCSRTFAIESINQPMTSSIVCPYCQVSYTIIQADLHSKPTKIQKNEQSDIQFHFLGNLKGNAYFCIITDDDRRNGQGISIRYHYYVNQPDNSIKSINYMQVPNFIEKPTRKETIELKEKLVWFFREFFPSKMEIVNNY